MKPPTWLLFSLIALAFVLLGLLFARSRVRQFLYPTATAMPRDVDKPVGTVIPELESAIEHNAPASLASLQPGLSAAEIAKLEREADIRLSDEARSLYAWRNGQVPESEEEFIPGHRFLSLNEAIEQKAALAQQVERATALQRAAHAVSTGHRMTWLPLFQDVAGDGYYYDPARPHAKGAVFYHFTETAEYIFFPSVKNLLAGVAECYSSGAYSADETGRLTEDFERTFHIWRKYGASSSP